MAALKRAPTFLEFARDAGRGCVFGTCVFDEGDRRLAGGSSRHEGKPPFY